MLTTLQLSVNNKDDDKSNGWSWSSAVVVDIGANVCLVVEMFSPWTIEFVLFQDFSTNIIVCFFSRKTVKNYTEKIDYKLWVIFLLLKMIA